MKSSFPHGKGGGKAVTKGYQMEMLDATRQGWSERKEVAIPTEIRYVVQWVNTPPGQSRARQAGSKALQLFLLES